MNLEIIKPFGPSIAKVKIPDNIVNEMNDYTDNIINNKSKSTCGSDNSSFFK